MRVLIIAALIGFAPFCNGGDGSLEPESSQYDFFLSDYRVAVIQKLSEAMGGAPRLQMLVLPSFQSEYVIGVIDGEEPFARIVTLDAQIWGLMQGETFDLDGNRPSATVTDMRITPELYGAIESYTCNAIKDVRYHEDESIGLDGVNFHFSAWCQSFGSPAGAKAWSPGPDTDAGKLIAVFQTLKEAAEKGESKQKRMLEKLLHDLRP